MIEDSPADNLTRVKLPPCNHYLSTGCTLLDLAMSNTYPGGVGGGRVCHFYGPASTAKTVIVQEILGAAQRAGGNAMFCDTEYTLDFDRAELFGLDVLGHDDEDMKGFMYRHPETIEEFFDRDVDGVLKAVRDGGLSTPVAIGVDSLTALPSMTEEKDALDKNQYNLSRAKMFSRAFRKYIGQLATAGVTLVLVDQTRENIGVVYGSKHTTSGGKAKEFYASTRVLLTHKGKILNKFKQPIGVRIGFTVEKNKLAPPFRKGEFQLLFDYGVDDISSNLEWIKDRVVEDHLESEFAVTKNGRWTWMDQKFMLSELVAHIEAEESGAMEGVLRDEVVRLWKIVYAPTGRTRRHV